MKTKKGMENVKDLPKRALTADAVEFFSLFVADATID
jgi:hypothetical protein